MSDNHTEHLTTTLESTMGDARVHMTTRPPAQLAPFHVEVHADRDTVRVVPVGELDLATVGTLQAELNDLREIGWSSLVLDLRRLEFLDSSGIRLLISEDQFARETGHQLSLISGPAAVQRVLEVCGLLDRLPFRAAE